MADPAPYESGDLHKDHAAAKNDVNQMAVNLSDKLRLAFERMGSNVDKKHVATMKKIIKDLKGVLDDVETLAAKEEKEAEESD
jgi:hypothetical protein